MKDIVIIGTENIGKEVVKIIEAINSKRNTWNVLGFISLKKDEEGSNIEGYSVLGSIDSMFNYFEGRKKDKFYFFKKLESQNELFTIIAIDNCKLKKEIENKLKNKIKFATIIHPDVTFFNKQEVGEGTIIYPGLIGVGRFKLGKHVILKQKCSLGNNIEIGDYSFISFNSNIDSNVMVREGSYIEANTTILANNNIDKNTYIKEGSILY
ncbi:acetyltransferase [Clostridium perfringens]|uniref:acetyltransferase n=1 Tax=Clostridium perfringens TaxID=1502 RepID=UPI002147C532|nr:acetyltransferase [Clostridium perfringens]MDK0615608.1 acetyltransferase [Clostridium perfringens]UUR81253.1 acetyltransferase [Clostridium perfringens]